MLTAWRTIGSLEGDAIQAEAIAPHDMAIVTNAVTDRLDEDAHEAVLDREERIRKRLAKVLDNLDFELGDLP
jgi:hypothetical protein